MRLEFCVGKGALLPETGGCEILEARSSEEELDAREGERRTRALTGGSGETAIGAGGSGEIAVEP